MAQSSPLLLFFRRLFRRRLVLAAAILLAIIVLLALLAPLLAPYDPTAIKVLRRLRPPSLENWFGTDEFGRDVFSRAIYGARASLGIGSAVVAIAMGLGTLFGLIAGYFRSLDGAVMSLVDAMMALPELLLAIYLVAMLGASAVTVLHALLLVV